MVEKYSNAKPKLSYRIEECPRYRIGTVRAGSVRCMCVAGSVSVSVSVSVVEVGEGEGK